MSMSYMCLSPDSLTVLMGNICIGMDEEYYCRGGGFDCCNGNGGGWGIGFGHGDDFGDLGNGVGNGSCVCVEFTPDLGDGRGGGYDTFSAGAGSGWGE